MSLRSAIKFHSLSKIRCRTLNEYFCFFSAVLIRVTKILIVCSVSSPFPIQYSMLGVRCSFFMAWPTLRSNLMLDHNLAHPKKLQNRILPAAALWYQLFFWIWCGMQFCCKAALSIKAIPKVHLSIAPTSGSPRMPGLPWPGLKYPNMHKFDPQSVRKGHCRQR